MRYSPEFIEQIKQRLSLVDEVRKVVPDLKKKGQHWWGCCPFHQEKTPSFHAREEGNYYCFGCGAHGDLISFVQETRGGNFADTIEHLAPLAGLELPKETIDPKAAKQRDDGYKALARADVFYQRHIGPEAQAYLDKRGLDAATVAEFGLGYAPDAWEALRTALTDEGFSAEILRTVGLTLSSEKKQTDYDRFRGRLMFPIHDLQHRVLGFGGRILDQGEPKYLNSPETPFFNKGHLLYNLQRAREHMKQAGQALLVEGYMDVIGLWQAGIKTAVAPLGTAVTEDHLRLLWRYQPSPIVCLDGDDAGRHAAVRAAKRALGVLEPGKTLQFVFLPQGEDPDSLVKSIGLAGFKDVLSKAVSLEEVLWQEVSSEGNLSTGDGRAQIDGAIQSLMREVANPTIKAHYQRALKDRLWQQSRSKQATPAVARAAWVPTQMQMPLARRMLALLFTYPQLVVQYEEKISEIVFENQEDKDLFTLLWRAFIEKRLAAEDLASYVSSCQREEAVAKLCDEAMGMRAVADEEAAATMFETWYGVLTQNQQLAEDRASVKEAWLESPSEETMQAFMRQVAAAKSAKRGDVESATSGEMPRK